MAQNTDQGPPGACKKRNYCLWSQDKEENHVVNEERIIAGQPKGTKPL